MPLAILLSLLMWGVVYQGYNAIFPSFYPELFPTRVARLGDGDRAEHRHDDHRAAARALRGRRAAGLDQRPADDRRDRVRRSRSIAAIAAFTARETYRIHVNDLGRPRRRPGAEAANTTACARKRPRPDHKASRVPCAAGPRFETLEDQMVSPTAELALGGGLKKSSTTTPVQVQELVTKARVAQAKFEKFTQEQVDAIVRDFGKYVYDNAESIARGAHKETGLGVFEDKVAKAKGKARVIWNNLKGKKSRGIIGEDEDANLVSSPSRWASSAAVCPVTNPIVTPMCNAMFALKAGNAVIFAPHPKAEYAHPRPDRRLPRHPQAPQRARGPRPDGH